ncbi:hypothetical protein Pla52n_55110 [Stieleria varia]|uniref:Uncharacterized protein n=1 Tax=Stieleria varia TaxID=2528005 RepID=A0A5C6A5H0_9BACT|nr:hypothetical protein Pla52n_55110 [Stieleria varia]
MNPDFRWLKKGPYPWWRVRSPIELRVHLDLLVGYGIRTKFLLPWCGIPLLKWRILAESSSFGEAWVSRSVAPAVSCKVWHSIEPMVEDLFSVFTEIHPGAELHLHSSKCLHTWKIRRELILDIHLRSRHTNLDHFSRIGSKLLCITLRILDERKGENPLFS